MKLKNINSIIDRIVSRRIYFTYNDSVYYYLFPDSSLKLKSSLLYEEHFEKFKYDDVLLEEDIDYHLEEYQIADGSLKKFIEQMGKKLDNIKVEYYENFYKDSKKKQLKRQIDNTINSISKTESQLHYLDRLTIENICATIQNEYLFANGIYDDNNNLIFNYNNIDSIDQKLFTIFSQIISEKFLNIRDFKSIARSNEWRIIWTIKNHPIFPGPVCEWTDEQRTLVTISQSYDNIYQHPDCPEEEIIDDDYALDGWSILQNRKIKEEKKQKGVDNILSRHKNAQEIFMVAETDQDLQNIMGLNNNAGLAKIQTRVNAVNQAGSVKESQLPDVRTDLINQASQQLKTRK
jgi:hypothetical protein